MNQEPIRSDVTLTVAESCRQSSLEGSLNAAPALTTRRQVVARAVECSKLRVADVVAVAADLETVAAVQQISRNLLVTPKCDARHTRSCDRCVSSSRYKC